MKRELNLDTTTVELLEPEFEACGLRVYSSLEGHQPGASIKDHLVVGELEALLRSGRIKPGDTLGEMSAGSTAFSLSHHCQNLGLKCVIFVPDTLDPDHIRRLERSAEVHPVPISEATVLYEAYCEKHGIHPLRQLEDVTKKRHYYPMALEIRNQLGPIDLVMGAVGTGHSLQGISEALGARSITAEPSGFPVSGVRNLDDGKFGPNDPCIAALFDERIIVTHEEYLASPTALGEMVYSDSFRLLLAASKKMIQNSDAKRLRKKKLFIVGARNRINQSGVG